MPLRDPAARLDGLIRGTRRDLWIYRWWCYTTAVAGVVALAAGLWFGVSEKSPLLALGSGFLLTLTRPPLTEMIRMRNRLEALVDLREELSTGDAQFSRFRESARFRALIERSDHRP